MAKTSTWKSVERKLAELLGGERVPVTGRQRGCAPDIEHPLFAIEVKHRASLPSWIVDALDQAVKSVRKDKVPVVILHENRMAYGNSLVLMKLGDLKELWDENQRLNNEVNERIP